MAAQSGALTANPLLLYYSFLNLAKTFILTSKTAASLTAARHGLGEDRGAGADELSGAGVKFVDDANKLNIFPLLIRALGYQVPQNGTRSAVLDLFPEVVVGHRLRREAGGAERYIPVEVVLAHDPAQQLMWTNLFVEPGDLSRFNFSHRKLIDEGGLAGRFREVRSPVTGFLCFEELAPLEYGDRPSDQIAELVSRNRPLLWRIATSTPPYRRYYLYVSPTRTDWPQVASLYALIFYFGSVTRYRPHIFNDILAGPYGAFVSEFVAAQPEQLLYLLASEVCEREVVKPAII
jgi:hypothetical protein